MTDRGEALTLVEKISLVEQLWNDIYRHNKSIAPDADESEYVEQRVKEVEASPKDWLNWAQVMALVKREHV